MIHNLYKSIRLHLPTLYYTLALIWGLAIFGIIIFEIVIQLAIHNGKSPEAFQIAFLMAFVACIGTSLFTGSISSYTSFNTAISMGCTRRHYVIMRTIFLFLNNLIGILSVVIIFYLEKVYLNLRWNSLPVEDDISFLMNPGLLFMLWSVGTIFPFFISALTLHFGKVVSIIMYIIWMVGCLSFAHIEDFIHSEKLNMFINFYAKLAPYQWCLILLAICIALYAVAYRLYKKQAVIA